MIITDNWEAWLVCGVETGATDEYVELVCCSILGDQAFFSDLCNLGEDYIAFVTCNCFKVPVARRGSLYIDVWSASSE